ncbi:MAG: FkbM family methyltransferase [Verrucomicrobiae bacterium]
MSLPEFIYTVLLKPRPLRLLANAVLCRMIPPRIRVRGATVIPNPADPVVCGALTLGVYEKDEMDFFCTHFKPGMTFVDVGANVGLYTALAIRMAAQSVLAVEPHAEAFGFLRKTVDANAPACPVFLENVAAGREQGELTLYSNPDNKGDNRLYPDPMLRHQQLTKVETLDALCEKHGIRQIDFLKMDVQGAEMLVLEGARAILSNSPRCLVMTEFWPSGLEKCGVDPRAYLEAFASLGFEVQELRDGHLRTASSEALIASTPGRQYRNIIGFRRELPLDKPSPV